MFFVSCHFAFGKDDPAGTNLIIKNVVTLFGHNLRHKNMDFLMYFKTVFFQPDSFSWLLLNKSSHKTF